ncbi:hypothetical protein [Sinorhizobium meliloti]|jgi:sugar phosphate isomerase/epimerase|uniref:hypothetical protein n=1 Tax=Rhizobium meliloti TaxID=382 RepID=UPI000FD2EB18|nr:hypothetical protein [Sinorhizobium meliloti]MQV20509.1 hypothetical protein [Sinorhizobium meliloti]MQV33071.1 hypothetical protein [Sinorhizobium meliloti]RVE85663.1 hypothetical protein CN240_01765 [Sinorhizobium meliloti]RVG49037.1 hypothetical protein CN227_03560 [Sinorhizobium meliloti]RVM03718.1 hypothetical protein CN125_29685 [Sinorhizobium meliloti]
MRTSIATVSISGELPEKLEAIAKAGLEGAEIFENDVLAFDALVTLALNGRNIGFGLPPIGSSMFDVLREAERRRMREAAKKAFARSTEEYLSR